MCEQLDEGKTFNFIPFMSFMNLLKNEKKFFMIFSPTERYFFEE